MTPSYRIVPLGREHDRAAFSCGDPEFDRYLQTQASQDIRRHLAAVYVALAQEETISSGPLHIRGYYTLSSCGLLLAELPEEERRRLPRYDQVPAVLLGRLAVGLADQHAGLGRWLVFDALRRVVRANETIAAWAVVVDARNEALVPWYVDRFGFAPVASRSTRLYLPIKQAAALLAR